MAHSAPSSPKRGRDGVPTGIAYPEHTFKDMSMDDSAPRREEMLVMKVGSGITAENVGTIATVMFIESGYDELDTFENKLILQQGKNSTFFLLGELPDEITYEKMVSSIGATLGVTLTITTTFAEEYLAGDLNGIPPGGTIVFTIAGVDDRPSDVVPVKIDLHKLDREDVSLRFSAPPQALALLGTVDEDEVIAAIKRELEVPNGCSLKILGLRRSMVKALGGEALQLSSKTFYAEVCAVRGASKQDPIIIM